MVLFRINRFSGTKWPWLMVLFRENVSGGTKSEFLGTCADRLSENMGYHSNLIAIWAQELKALTLTNPCCHSNLIAI